MMTALHDRSLLNESEVAKLLRVSQRTLQDQRYRRVGLPFLRVGRRVLYDEHAVASYLDRNTVVPTDTDSRAV